MGRWPMLVYGRAFGAGKLTGSDRLYKGHFAFTRKLILKAKGLATYQPSAARWVCDAAISKGLKVRPKSLSRHPLLITPRGFIVPGSRVSFEETQPNPNPNPFSELEPINFQTGNDWKDQQAMRFFYFHRRPLRHR